MGLRRYAVPFGPAQWPRDVEILPLSGDARVAVGEAILLRIRGLGYKPECLVLNKCDKLSSREATALARQMGGVPISALTGWGVEELLRQAELLLFPADVEEIGARRIHAIGRGA